MKKYTLSVEIELAENFSHWQVEDLERKILDCGRKSMQDLFSKVLRDYEKFLLRKQGPACTLKERCPKKLATLFGEMKYERYRIWDSRLKKSRYPLDESLRLAKWSRQTTGYEESAVRLSVCHSYRNSQKEILEQTGVQRSHMAQWSLIQKNSQRQQEKTPEALDWQKLILPKAPILGAPDPCEAMGIDLDGTYCRSWKTKRFTKDHAVKVAVLYRHKTKISSKRWKLEDKQIVASEPQESLESFYNRVIDRAVSHYGLHQRTQVVVHGDGDPWIKNFAFNNFANVLYRLDPWHVKKKIRESTGIKKLPPAWEEALYTNPNKLISSIQNLHDQFANDEPSKNKTFDLINYLKNNLKGLEPSNIPTHKKKKFPRLYKRGSGTIERNIDWTVNMRFKQPRMSWSHRGLKNLLFLRQNFLNDHLKPRFPRVPASKPQLLCLL